MEIILNGQPMTFEEGISVAALVEMIADDPRGVAIERNREIVPKALHGQTILQAGDQLEVVQFVGGG